MVRTEEALTKLQPPRGCLVFGVPATAAPTCIDAHNLWHVVRAEQPGNTAAQSPLCPRLDRPEWPAQPLQDVSVNGNSSPLYVLTLCPHLTSTLPNPRRKPCSANHNCPQNFSAILCSTTF